MAGMENLMEQLDKANARYHIPEISDEKLEGLSAHIKPLVRRGDQLFFIEDPDPRNVAFPWSPVLKEAAEDLEVLSILPTLHSFGYHGLFKPSVAEVLAQIPDELLEEAIAFEVHAPQNTTDLSRQWDAVNSGYHVAATTVYRQSILY